MLNSNDRSVHNADARDAGGTRKHSYSRKNRLMAFPTETKGLEAYAIARVSATGFTWSGDFDNLTSSETIVSSDWIGELYAR